MSRHEGTQKVVHIIGYNIKYDTHARARARARVRVCVYIYICVYIYMYYIKHAKIM